MSQQRGQRTLGNDLPLLKHHGGDKVQVNFRSVQQGSHGKMNPNKRGQSGRLTLVITTQEMTNPPA